MGYAKRISSTDIIGFHAFYLDSGSMIRRTLEDHNAGTFRVYNVALRGTYAKIFTDRLKVGVSLKYIREDIWTTYMQTFAIDIGSNFLTHLDSNLILESIDYFRNNLSDWQNPYGDGNASQLILESLFTH